MKQRFKEIEAILFDLDGVLVDSFYFWFHLLNDTLEHFGHNRIFLKVFRQHWGKSTEEDIKNFMPERTIKEVKAYFFANMHRFTRYIKINTQAKPVLKTLVKKYKLGCVSNSHTEILKWQLKKCGLEGYFKIVISADDVKIPKPAPDMLLEACKGLKVKPENTIFVGDTKTDMIAGKNAGCVTIGYKIDNRIKVNSLKDLLKVTNKIKS